MTTHARVVYGAYLNIDGERTWFASTDGELYIEVVDDPRSYPASAVEDAMNNDSIDWRPMRITKPLLVRLNAAFDHEP